jgi:serine/threonine protein kinase
MMSYFDCKELQEDIELYFDNLKVIGTGAFGTVYSADTTLKAYEEIGVDLPSTIALKELSIYAEGREELLHEIQIIKRLDNPWTMKYYGCFESNSLLYIVTELVPGKDLYDCISDRLVTLDQKDIIVKISASHN